MNREVLFVSAAFKAGNTRIAFPKNNEYSHNNKILKNEIYN